MPGIAEIRPIPKPPDLGPWEERIFPAPAGDLRLRFHSPYEFAMGGYTWTVTLEGSEPVKSWEGAGQPDYLQPWSSDGQKLAFPLSRDESSVLASLADGSEIAAPHWPRAEYLVALVWAPAHSRVLLLGEDHVDLLDGKFRALASCRWTPDEFDLPLAGWLDPDDAFFVFRPWKDAEIAFYSGDDASTLEVVPLEPSSIFPYDEEALAGLPRNRYVLELGEGTFGTASLLDQWTGCSYRAGGNDLFMCTYRPTGEIERGVRREPTVRAEQRWVSVRLAP